ncbi:ATP-binding protein, partial [Bacteroides acidifaciens]
VDQSRNRQTGGTGLGLYIVKTILDLHGAKIEIANTIQGVIVSVQF